jgi:hypothetical protein
MGYGLGAPYRFAGARVLLNMPAGCDSDNPPTPDSLGAGGRCRHSFCRAASFAALAHAPVRVAASRTGKPPAPLQSGQTRQPCSRWAAGGRAVRLAFPAAKPRLNTPGRIGPG